MSDRVTVSSFRPSGRFWPPPFLLAWIGIGIAAAVILAGLSVEFDARFAADARELGPDSVAWGSFISALGASGYMFSIVGILIIGAAMGQITSRTPTEEEAWRLLAERTVFVLAVLSISGLVAQFIKHVVGRARPRYAEAFGPYHFDMWSMKSSLASFPSGHSATAFAMATALALLFPRVRVALFVLAAAVAASRIVVQAHYLSDIAAGSAVGIGSARVIAHVFARRSIAVLAEDRRIRIKAPGAIVAGLGR